MSLTSVIEERVVFGRGIQPDVNACLQESVACANDFERARELSYRARDMQPEQIEVYVALYKFCLYRGYLDEAEQVALDALKQSAQNNGFTSDWQKLDASSADWTQHEGPARLFLYSLKALAFIRLRKSEPESAQQLLEKLQELDTQDLVGSSVIMDLSKAL